MKTLLMVILAGATLVMSQNEIKLWAGAMPGVGADKPEGFAPNKGDGTDRLTNVSEPSLKMFLLKDTTKPTPFVIVCPGGGYNILSWNKEGTDIAAWLNSIGVSAAVLKYR